MIYLSILTALFVALALVLTGLLIGNLAPNRKKMMAELDRMKAELKTWAGDLAPINRSEMELFSMGQQKHVLRRGVSTTAKGIYTTIFHEPVAAYTYKQFAGKQKSALLFARTAEHDYAYLTHKGQTSLFIDGQEVGSLNADGVLKGLRTGKELARVQAEKAALLPIVVGEREIGSISRKSTSAVKGLNDRAFEFLKPDINDKEEQLFLALALKELVSQVVEK